MTTTGPLYLSFDLSTQQLKGLVVTADLKVVHNAKFDFDADAFGFDVTKGVITNEAEHEVFAPVAMFLQAIDNVLDRLRVSGLRFEDVRGISGAGMQHGSVFWNANAEPLLSSLDSDKTLQQQLDGAFSYPFSPNWQDASTQKECDEFDAELGRPEALAQATGSSAHHRFTGPQILRFQRKHPSEYVKTKRISLVSSFLASIFLGKFAPFDISDVCGMNLWDVKSGKWNDQMLALAAGSYGVDDLQSKLGDVPEDGGVHLGSISTYFIERYGFSPKCTVIASTGDNPSTILALPLRQNDAMVSLGTSTTFLMSTPEYKPDPAVHFFNSPTTAGLYMFMLCYKNGGLARENVRDDVNKSSNVSDSITWEEFDNLVETTAPLAQNSPSSPMQMGLFFPRPEIVPNLPEGEWHYSYDSSSKTLSQSKQSPPASERAKLIVESQLLSLRLRSRDLVRSPNADLPPQPRRIYLVGGGSRNSAIAKLAGQVLGGSEGIYTLDVGENACALGAAHKAVWACERKEGESFEELIEKRWDESAFARKIAEGYQKGVWEKYGEALDGFEEMEKELLKKYANKGADSDAQRFVEQ